MTVTRTWKPTVAGILNIIAGVLSALSAIMLVIGIIAMGYVNIMDFLPPAEAPFVAPILSIILIIALVFSVIGAVFPIVGGVFALQRRKWGWTLAGSIIAILGTLPLGVLATIFVAISRDEFE